MEPDNQIEKIIPEEIIAEKIFVIRGQKVMVDSDLADLFEIPTKRLNEQVKRNIKRFPSHFMFKITEEEKKKVVAICDHLQKLKFSPYLPRVFTEHGVVMLASILNSDRAISASVKIVETFINMRRILRMHENLLTKFENLEQRVSLQDENILLLFDMLRSLEQDHQDEEEFRQRKRIGFRPEAD